MNGNVAMNGGDCMNGVDCMIMRGGTSKGAYFLSDQLPADPSERDDLLQRIMGTPDPRQIDGIGGAHPLTSKIAIVGLSNNPEADVEYLFLQIGVEEPTVSDRQNCGNLLAGIGPFAIERGLMSGSGPTASVRVHMLNTDSIATASFAMDDGHPVYAGDVAISGVPGTASPVRLDFAGIAGSSCGALLPTANIIDELDGVQCTLIDNGMPVVVMRADALGVSGYETCEELETNAALRERLEIIRQQAGFLMNLGDVTDTTVPKLTMVAPPRHGGHLSTRTFIPHRCHEAIGVLGAVSVATAALLTGSPSSDMMIDDDRETVSLEHPTGTFEAAVGMSIGSDGTPTIERAGIIRTTRKLMDGTVYPREYRPL